MSGPEIYLQRVLQRDCVAHFGTLVSPKCLKYSANVQCSFTEYLSNFKNKPEQPRTEPNYYILSNLRLVLSGLPSQNIRILYWELHRGHVQKGLSPLLPHYRGRWSRLDILPAGISSNIL